jgi:hypothetical protein
MGDDGLPIALRLERWSDGASRLKLGQRVSARIRSLKPDQGGAFVETRDKAEAFLRLPAGHGLTEGQLIDVTVLSEARQDKLPRVSMKETDAESFGIDFRDNIPVEDVEIGDEQVEAAFEDALSPAVVIPNGGRLRIDRTHALVAVDIDSAGRRGKGSAASKALQLNLDACDALSRQIGLRKLGGLIILDCVAPLNAGSRQKVLNAMKSHLERTGFPTATVLAPSQLGLMEMSLPWREIPLDERVLDERRELSDESLCLAGLRLLERTAAKSPMDQLVLELPERAMTWLEGRGAPLMATLSDKYGHRVSYLASTKRAPIVYQAP